MVWLPYQALSLPRMTSAKRWFWLWTRMELRKWFRRCKSEQRTQKAEFSEALVESRSSNPMNEMNGGEKPVPLLDANNLAFVEALYEDFTRIPASVPSDWQQYFSQVANGELRFPKPRFGPSFKPYSIFNPPDGTDSKPLS